MERLTRRDSFNGTIELTKEIGEPIAPYKEVMEALKKLAAYEDTGLEPEEVKDICALCDDYVAAGLDVGFVRACIDAVQSGMSTERIAEIAKADAEDRLVVLPCKVGDVVYQRDYYGNLYEATVQSIVIDNRRTIFITSGIGFDCDAIGKSVFFTSEEAEAALKQEDEYDDGGTDDV